MLRIFRRAKVCQTRRYGHQRRASCRAVHKTKALYNSARYRADIASVLTSFRPLFPAGRLDKDAYDRSSASLSVNNTEPNQKFAFLQHEFMI